MFSVIDQDPGVSLLMLLINVDGKTPKIWLRSDTNVAKIGIKSGPSPIFWGVVGSDVQYGVWMDLRKELWRLRAVVGAYTLLQYLLGSRVTKHLSVDLIQLHNVDG